MLDHKVILELVQNLIVDIKFDKDRPAGSFQYIWEEINDKIKGAFFYYHENSQLPYLMFAGQLEVVEGDLKAKYFFNSDLEENKYVKAYADYLLKKLNQAYVLI